MPRTPANAKSRRARRGGQAAIFALMIVVILFFVVLWNFDLHKTLHVKGLSQNGGDAAAVMAARWQGISLNLIGDLNVMRALALSADDARTEASISNLQARLTFVGPMIGFMAAQQAAKNNGIYQNDGFTRMIRDHAQEVRNDYPSRRTPDGLPLFPEPYPGAWEDYADMLEAVANDGVAAGPENANFYTDPDGHHYLLQQAFYDAVAGRDWCWFHGNARDLLHTYDNYTWWPDLPPLTLRAYINSEIFGLGLGLAHTSADAFIDAGTLGGIAAARALRGALSPTGMATVASWYVYGPPWTAWAAMAQDGPDPFPLTGPVRDSYDYAGADAAVRVESLSTRLTPGPGGAPVERTITWTAAAKPFGSLENDERPNAFGLVLPAFDQARLIPLDASSVGDGGGFNLLWREHVELHLPDYVATGRTAPNCRYCSLLRTWEDPDFRQSGIDWLSANSARCNDGGGGGGGPGGGRRRGH